MRVSARIRRGAATVTGEPTADATEKSFREGAGGEDPAARRPA